MKDNEKTIDDIIAMLDNFTSNEFGHINILVDEGNIEQKNIEKTNSLECLGGDVSCKVPTLFEGLEDLNDS